MNRLSSICIQNTNKVSLANMGAFGKKAPLSSAPVFTSFGRGYGLRKPLTLSPNLEAASSSHLFRTMATTKDAEVVKKSDPSADFDTIRKNIASLCDKEIEGIEEFEADSLHADVGKNFLQESGFTLKEENKDSDEGEERFAILEKETNKASIKVTFSTVEEEPEEDEEEGAGEEGEEGEEGGTKDVSEHPEFDSLPRKHSFQIEINVKGKDGKVVGQFFVDGFAGADNRLYADQITIGEGDTVSAGCLFDALNDELQDRIYDYLDQLGADDKLALFMKSDLQQYVVRKKSESDIAFLKKFKSLITA